MKITYLTAAIFLLSFGDAFAYVGPGLGLGAIGAVFGVILTVLLAVLGLVWYPARRIFRKMTGDKTKPAAKPE